MTGRRIFKLVVGISLAGFVLLSAGAIATAKDKPGKGKGREKVTLCHKGKVTITVGRPAVRAHLRHGDSLGHCSPAAAPTTATLRVIKHVVNDSGGTLTAGDFTLTIHGVTAVGGNSFAGSAAGVTKTVTSFGSYSVGEAVVPGYVVASASPDCSGTIAAGQTKTCVITNNDRPARLTVFKQVINDSGGTKVAADFTISIAGVTAIGGNTFSGSGTGVTRQLASVGAYSVSELPVHGYALTSASSDCLGTISLGEHKICVLTNDDVGP